MGPGGSQDQARARDERCQELPDRRVEGDRRLLHDAVGRTQRENRLHPAHVVHQGRVRHQDALGRPRRSGGVDGVGDRRGVRRDAQIRIVLPLRPAVAAVERENMPANGRQPVKESLLRQDDRGACLPEHEGEPVLRPGRIEGKPGDPGLE